MPNATYPSLLRRLAAMVYDTLLLAAVTILYGFIVVAINLAIQGAPATGEKLQWGAHGTAGIYRMGCQYGGIFLLLLAQGRTNTGYENLALANSYNQRPAAQLWTVPAALPLCTYFFCLPGRRLLDNVRRPRQANPARPPKRHAHLFIRKTTAQIERHK